MLGLRIRWAMVIGGHWIACQQFQGRETMLRHGTADIWRQGPLQTTPPGFSKFPFMSQFELNSTNAVAGPSNASKDEISMTSILLAPLTDLQSLSHTLFLSLSPVQSKPPPPPSLTAFLACDKALSSAVNLAHKHQIKQRRIYALENEILELEARWREIASELESGKRELEEMIEEGEQRIKAIEEAKKGEQRLT